MTFYAGLLEVIIVVGAMAMLASWILVCWGFNLWVLVSIHVLGNLWWYLWGEGQQGLYSGLGNGIRLSMIILLVAMTVYKTRRTTPSVTPAVKLSL